ncbi:MAG: SDR family NAD(P)-dependent oxidoreductase [Magnetococcus sp. DMHC-1]|nr:SDR family NAD(P)-dependent oxidoreductase [Magnetococcales bacterium]
MSDAQKIVAVIGCSKGLGAAMVRRLLQNHPTCWVLGVARTAPEAIPDYTTWVATGRFRYLCGDIGNRNLVPILQRELANIPGKHLTVIFNAANTVQDVNVDRRIDFNTFHQVNCVGVDGLGNLLEGIQERLLTSGGTLAGISSINALKPPVVEMRLAYGPSKAYLDMTLRVLAQMWREQVHVITIHLGRIEGSPGQGHYLLRKPSYSDAAMYLLNIILRPNPPTEVTYPLPYRIFYRWIFPVLPDRWYFRIMHQFFSSS